MDQFALPISQNVLFNQLELSRSILEKWTKQVESLPGINTPGGPADLERVLREMIGELQLVSGQCESLAEILGTAIV